jgi:hypothetical protein
MAHLNMELADAPYCQNCSDWYVEDNDGIWDAGFSQEMRLISSTQKA